MKHKLSVQEYSLMLAGEFAAFGAGAVILLVFIASTLDASLIQNGQQAAVVTSALVELANADREQNHLGTLTVSPKLTAVAQAKANDMAEQGYFAHNSPDGKTPWYWFRQVGYSFQFAGENLAVDFSDSNDVEDAWMESPTHRANLLNPKFTEVGIATAVGTYKGHKTVFVVQEFATPSASQASAPPTHAPAPEVVAAVVASSAPAVLGSEAGTAAEPNKAPEAAPAPATEPAPPTMQADVPVVEEAPPSVVSDLHDNFAASPKTTLRYAYYLFALLILLALVIETGFEIKKHHVKHVVLAVCLLALMGTLLVSANYLVFTTPTVSVVAPSLGV